MAFCRVGFTTAWEGLELLTSSGNLPNQRQWWGLNGACGHSPSGSFISSRRKRGRKCSLRTTVSSPGFRGKNQGTDSFLVEEDLSHAMKFDMSDFEICNLVSVGLAGRSDEIIFEAIVKNRRCPLYNSRVVLRQLASSQARRRGRRALEVLKKLARRQLLYHSYAMQVHGYVSLSKGTGNNSFTLVHGYHGSYSLRHWLQHTDWLPTLEATLALDEEYVRKVGDDRIGGPAITRKLRLIRILMRDLLIGVNYLHSHGLAHTELRLENLHISPVDRHIKVGILGNASDFHDENLSNNTGDGNAERRLLMIAFDMRCLGFIMVKMVLQELMDPPIFMKFKSFLNKGNDPSCLREFLLPILSTRSPSENAGLQMLDRNWGAGWHLLSQLLATRPSERISCLDALRHPFLCGPRWRVEQSTNMTRWGLGSAAVQITEEYIYDHHQRNRLAYFVELLEILNSQSKLEDWLELLPGRWRLLYSTGRHIGLTLRQPSPQVLIGYVCLTFTHSPTSTNTFFLASDIEFRVLDGSKWPHDKMGTAGRLQTSSPLSLAPATRLYHTEDNTRANDPWHFPASQESIARKVSNRKWAGSPFGELPSSLPVAKFVCEEIEIAISLDSPSLQNAKDAGKVLREVRTQVPPEMFDLSKFACGTYLDSRTLILRGINGSALLFTRSNGL